MSSFYRLSLRSSWSLLLLLFVASSVYGQDTTNISITGRNMPISGFIRQLESKTGFSFIYGKAAFDDQERVSLTLANVGLSEALSALFKGKNLSWQYREKTVILSRQAPQNSQVTSDSAPQYSVAGTVVDPQGNPIEGASVALRGQSRGQGTNSKGEFSFSGIPENAVLVVSSIGYAAKQLRLSGQREVRVALDTLVHEIEGVEVVSTGYQDIPKERATGSFFRLDNKLINRSVSTNILDRVIGVTSGLNLETRNTGARGKVTIRGISTINANNRPLIVVDGFAYDEGDQQFLSFQNWINNINPNDIETITVLKDAAAASIWGARSGNGVIVISTKKGKLNQRPKIQLNTNVMLTEKPNLFYQPIIPTANFVDIEGELFEKGFFDGALANTLSYPVVSKVIEILDKKQSGIISPNKATQELELLKRNDIRNDINKYLRRTGINQQYVLNISGGTSSLSYYSSIGYDDNRSTNKGDDYNRLTFRLSNTYKPTKNIEAETYINFVQNINKNNSVSINIGSPYLRLKDDNGNNENIPFGYRQSFLDTLSFPSLLDWNYRPLDELGLNDNVNKQFDIRTGGNIRYSPYKGLTAEIKYQYQKTLINQRIYYAPQSYFARNLVNQYMSFSRRDGRTIIYPVPNGAILDQANSESTSWNLRGQLNYNYTRESQYLTVIVGAEAREIRNEGKGNDRLYGYDNNTGTSSSQINFDSAYSLRPSGTARVPTIGSGTGLFLNRYLSYYGNIAYTLNDKYTLSASSRLDGSNFFGIKANQRLIPLWSSGFSWNLSNERFYQVSWLPYLKLRATYGFNGNMRNDATAYPTIRYRTSSASALIDAVYTQVVTPGNPNLRWEKVRMVNLGIDFKMTDSKISGSVEYYMKKGINLIGPILLDATTGFFNFTGNRACIDGKGIDLVINSVNVTGNFSWTTNFLFSYNTDRIILYEGAGTGNSNNKSVFLSGLVINKPLDALYSYRWAGLDPNNGDPRFYVADSISSFTTANTNAKSSDLVYNGPQSPILFGSLLNDIHYKNISISFNIIYKLGYYFRRSSVNYSTLLLNYSGGVHLDYLNRWEKPGDEFVTNIPSMPEAFNSARDDVYSKSQHLVERADHVRLQDIRLSYNLNRSDINKLPFENVQIYAYASNLGVLWRANKYGIDPDYSSYESIPNPRTIALGLNVSF